MKEYILDVSYELSGRDQVVLARVLVPRKRSAGSLFAERAHWQSPSPQRAPAPLPLPAARAARNAFVLPTSPHHSTRAHDTGATTSARWLLPLAAAARRRADRTSGGSQQASRDQPRSPVPGHVSDPSPLLRASIWARLVLVSPPSRWDFRRVLWSGRMGHGLSSLGCGRCSWRSGAVLGSLGGWG